MRWYSAEFAVVHESEINTMDPLPPVEAMSLFILESTGPMFTLMSFDGERVDREAPTRDTFGEAVEDLLIQGDFGS